MSEDKVCSSGHVFSPGDALCSRCNTPPVNQEPEAEPTETVNIPVKDADPIEPENVPVEVEPTPAIDPVEEPAVTEPPPAE